MSGGRPPEKPLPREGRFTWMRLGSRLIAFPAETASKEDIECIRAINSGYAKGLSTDLTTAQHESLMRFRRNHAIDIG